MITLRETINVKSPIEKVYDYLVNLENVQRWQPAVIEVTRLTEGPTRVGTSFREVVRFMGRQYTSTCEIVELEPNRMFAFNATSDGPLEYKTKYTFEPADGGTRLEIVGSFQTKGAWRLLEPIMKGEIRKESQMELVAVKKAIESLTP
jgi:uncharacterized protein YndB with AHSA1/START domain